jgi:hypothetical protein
MELQLSELEAGCRPLIRRGLSAPKYSYAALFQLNFIAPLRQCFAEFLGFVAGFCQIIRRPYVRSGLSRDTVAENDTCFAVLPTAAKGHPSVYELDRIYSCGFIQDANRADRRKSRGARIVFLRKDHPLCVGDHNAAEFTASQMMAAHCGGDDQDRTGVISLED